MFLSYRKDYTLNKDKKVNGVIVQLPLPEGMDETRIVNTINQMLTNSDEETKHQFIDTLFDFFDRLNIDKLPSEGNLLGFFASKIPALVGEWKNTSLEGRSAVKKIAFELIKDYFANK